MATEKRLIADALKKYHDAKFTPGVYEHSIFGKAALLLETDAVEVVHGRWGQARYTEAPLYICSECDKSEYKQHRYCPHCGAKMDGGADRGNL